MFMHFQGVTDEFSEGCNFLIKTNRAALINHPRDLVYYLGWNDEKPKKIEIQSKLPLLLVIGRAIIVNTLKIGH
jgi:DNA processing protein